VDPSCDLSTLRGTHIHKIAPILLGSAAWRLLSPNDINNWADFVREVETQFGVNTYQQERQFKSLYPGPTENGY
jgi:hypothetical protein